MPRTDLARIDLVVVEILARQHAVLVADQSILEDGGGIELDLDLHVLGDREQRRGQLGDEHLARFRQRVDVRVVAVAGIGQPLQQLIVVVARAEAERRERHTAGALPLGHVDERFVVDDADVEVAVGREHDAVDAVLDLRIVRELVRALDAFGAIGRAAGFEAIDRFADLLLLIAGRRLQHDAGAARIHDHRHAVARRQLICEQAERVLQQRQLVRRLHRARHVDQEHEVRGRPLGGGDVESLDADLHEQRLRIPRRRRHFRSHAERHVAARRRRVAVVEIVDHLLDTHRVLRRQLAGVEEAAHVGVRAGVDVDGERRDRLIGDEVHRVVVEVLIALGVGRLLIDGPAAHVRYTTGHDHGFHQRGVCGHDARRWRLLVRDGAAGDVRPVKELVRFLLRSREVDFLAHRLRLRALPVFDCFALVALGGTGGNDGSHDQQRAAAQDAIHGSSSLRAPAAPRYRC